MASKLIALTSTGPLSGKTTLAKYLEREHGFIRADHSRSVVSSFVTWANNLPDPERWGLVLPLTVEHVYKYKELYRVWLQEHGNRAGFNDPAEAKGWLLFTLSLANVPVVQARCPGAKPQITRDVVLDSFRGEAQAQALRELGFTLVQLEIREEERVQRAVRQGVNYYDVWEAMQKRPELELGIKSPDITLNGEADVEHLARLLANRPTHLRDEIAKG